MANSKLLKEAIADAKAVRETAIANAKIALEEAFTPRLQSILSRKLQAEMEGEEEEVVEDIDSSEIGAGDNAEPAAVADDASTDLSGAEEETAEVGEEDENTEVVSEEEDMEMSDDEEMMEGEEEMEAPTMDMEEEEMMDDDELDLESIIRELESELEEEDANEDGIEDDVTGATMEEEEMEVPAEEPAMEEEEEMEAEPVAMEEEDDTIDLEEILREMGYGDDEEVVEEEEMATDNAAELEAELEEAYATIKELRSAINEVNLLNAKLLYANKLFRGYNLTNEQKVKVVENLDRTNSVREVKLVYATLAESMKFGGAERKQTAKRVVSEGISSKPVASTAPKKEIIAESNELADRFKKLAGII